MSRHMMCGAALAMVLAGMPAGAFAHQKPAAAASAQMPAIHPVYYSLSNGLRVILLQDSRVPTVTVSVMYGIGFRVEPRDRTGFAHLFEHLLFQGSENAPRGHFINLISNAGGDMNGSTRYDYTNYYEVVPSGALEAMLWGEADRMARPVLNNEVLANQQGVVENEVKVNVLNQPYGGWPWLVMPQAANTNWHNAHNFYGEMADLKAATLEEAEAFHARFYGPNNSVLFVGGDFDEASARGWIEQYFGPIAASAPVQMPDVSEPRQLEPRRAVHHDPLAPNPAWAAGWHMPQRHTPKWYAMVLIDQLMIQNTDSRLYDKLVRQGAVTAEIEGGINLFGSAFTYDGPMEMVVSLTHDPDKSEAEITAAVDEVVLDLQTRLVPQRELDRALTKIRSSLYDTIDSADRFDLAEMLSVYALFDDNPSAFNEIEARFAAVTPELVRETAREYLREGNRTIVVLQPAADASATEVQP